MNAAAWCYLLFTVTLAGTLAGIIVHYARGARRERVEAPKFRMLDDDPRNPD